MTKLERDLLFGDLREIENEAENIASELGCSECGITKGEKEGRAALGRLRRKVAVFRVEMEKAIPVEASAK